MVRPPPAPPELTMPTARWIFHQISASPSAPLVAAIVGPGGAGKSMLLDAVAREYSKANVTTVRGASDGDRWLDRLTGDSPVLIDDAHRLPEKMLQRLRTLTESDTA
ncbi:MAG: hypothetical protein ACRD3Q_12250, partial [Terriglobales bacterium]